MFIFGYANKLDLIWNLAWETRYQIIKAASLTVSKSHDNENDTMLNSLSLFFIIIDGWTCFIG